MSRILLGIAAALIAVWVVFAMFNAVRGFVQLALVIAVVLVGFNVLTSLRRRSE
jgi:hypothetical protein